jgi:hypothetical protein
VPSDVSVEPIPVRKTSALGSEPGFLSKWRQQTINIILQKDLKIQITGVLEWSVKQSDITQRKRVLVESLLGKNVAGKEDGTYKKDQ